MTGNKIYNGLKGLVPRRIKEAVANKIRAIAKSEPESVDMKRLRQELDLLNYRIDELSTQLSILSERVHEPDSTQNTLPTDNEA